MPRLPTLFVSHASPMLALQPVADSDYHRWAQALPRPRAILVFSAHWEGRQLALGETATHTHLVYDFGGFPDALYRVQYPAPGAPELAASIRNLLQGRYEPVATARGLDHGVWVPFLHMWPAADIPVLQMSLPSHYSNEQLYALGRALAPLRDAGFLIIGSGTLTHNLRAAFSRHYDAPPEWVTGFDHWVEEALLHDRERLLRWQAEAPYAVDNHPSPEHFRPLLVVAGAADADDPVGFPIHGFEMNLFSRRSVQFGG